MIESNVDMPAMLKEANTIGVLLIAAVIWQIDLRRLVPGKSLAGPIGALIIAVVCATGG